MNVTVAFRREMPAGISHIRLAAGNVWRVWLGERMIAYGPMRAAHGETHLWEHDLCLVKPQMLTVEVVAYNINSYCQASGEPFFGIEVTDGQGALLADCDGFRCFHLSDRVQKVNKYSMQRFFVEVYREEVSRRRFYLGEDLFPEEETTEVAGAKLLPDELPMPDFSELWPIRSEDGGRTRIDRDKEPYESDWFYPSEVFRTRGFARGELEVDLSHEVSRIVFGEKGEGSCTLAVFPYNATGFLAFEYRGRGEIYVTFDELPFEYPFRNCALNAVKLTVNGSGSFLSIEPYTLQYARIMTFGSAEVVGFHLVAYENSRLLPLPELEDRELDLIFRAGVRTFCQNAVDILTDCPSRERAGWLCDSFFTARAEHLLTGECRVERNMLTAFLHAPFPFPSLPEGMLPMCYPADLDHGTYIANWALWLILQLREYLQRSADRDLIKAFRPKVYALLEFFRKYENEDGLIEDMDSWVFVEWSRANDLVAGVNSPSNMLYSGALRAAGELYADEVLFKKAELVAEAVRRQSYDGRFFRDQALREGGKLVVQDEATETCQYYAFYFGIAAEENYPELHHIMFDVITRDNIREKYPSLAPSNAFIGNVLRLDHLASHGRVEQAIAECRGYYLYMAERTGTLWEHIAPEASCCHGFASVVTIWIAAYYGLSPSK